MNRSSFGSAALFSCVTIYYPGCVTIYYPGYYPDNYPEKENS